MYGLAVLDQLVRHRDGRVRRYGEANVLGARLTRRQVGYVYADDPAFTVCQSAARVTWEMAASVWMRSTREVSCLPPVIWAGTSRLVALMMPA